MSTALSTILTHHPEIEYKVAIRWVIAFKKKLLLSKIFCLDGICLFTLWPS